jgi:tryptophan 2,3-dioxygenase
VSSFCMGSISSASSVCHRSDEFLFITVHQTAELWFSQIIHELKSVVAIFSGSEVPAKLVGIATERLDRIVKIQGLLLNQLSILETMSPMGFLEFRDLLFSASGFQSFQFRMFENMLGLKPEDRIKYGREGYCSFLKAVDAAKAEEVEHGDTLLQVLDAWLSRTPFLEMEGFDFWEYYRAALEKQSQADRDTIMANTSIDEEARAALLADVEGSRESFAAMFDEEEYKKLVERGDRRLSYKAFKAAIFIQLYGDEPILHAPARVLKLIRDVEESLTLWRHNHSLMVHRMIGAKMGTGGSSGFHYLRATTSKHRVFSDLFDMATYLVPSMMLPPLPPVVTRRLGYVLESGGATPAVEASTE